MMRPNRSLTVEHSTLALRARFPPLHWYLPNAFSHPPELIFAALLLCSVHGLSTRRLTRCSDDASKLLAHCRAFDTRSEGEFFGLCTGISQMHFLIDPSCFSQRYCCVAFTGYLPVA